ncbi:hypothetical protein BGZ58_000538 [Dissophora ornata]|nr:hypothetical protein BGZ58_000538 [Dissophora ornata]
MRTLISEISRTSRKASQPQHHIQPTASSTIADMSGFLEAHKQALYTNHLVLDSGFKFSTTESMPSTNTANVHDTIQPHQGIDMDVRGTVNSKSDTGSSNDDYKMRTNRRGAAGKSRASKNVCDKCGRVYTRPFNLRSHRLTHDDKKPFGCQSLIGIKGCILHFTRRHDLIRHVRAKHPGVHWSNNGTNNPDTPEAVASAVTTSVTEERVREEELDKASEAFAAFITTAAITEEEHVKEEVLDTESESFAAFITTAAIIEEEHVKEEVPDTGSEAFAAFTATAAVIEEEHVKEEELESEASATFIATARTWKRRNS